MTRHSAGLLLFRRGRATLEVLLVHPGGPIWARRDMGAWSIPKGEVDEGEDLLAAAEREVAEELGGAPPPGTRLALGDLVQRGGKRVTAWATEWDLDVTAVRSNTFELEWPPRSGVRRAFPEVDRAAWFGLREARARILASQVPFLDRLAALIDVST